MADFYVIGRTPLRGWWFQNSVSYHFYWMPVSLAVWVIRKYRWGLFQSLRSCIFARVFSTSWSVGIFLLLYFAVTREIIIFAHRFFSQHQRRLERPVMMTWKNQLIGWKAFT